MKHSLLYTMGNQYTGLGGSVLDQHSTNILGEIKDITVLSILPIYRAPLKFTMKQKQKRSQKPYLLHCFSVHVLFLTELSNQKQLVTDWNAEYSGSSSSPYMSQH